MAWRHDFYAGRCVRHGHHVKPRLCHGLLIQQVAGRVAPRQSLEVVRAVEGRQRRRRRRRAESIASVLHAAS